MSCCGGGTPDTGLDIPIGERQPGDVLAMALWAGNLQERGRITGRLYPRSGNNKQMWVAPQDIGARPDLWRVVEPEIETAQPDGLNLIADYFRTPAPYQPEAVLPAKRADTTPNFARLTEAFSAETPLSNQEINALRDGHTIEVSSEGVKINRKHAPDIVTTKRARK